MEGGRVLCTQAGRRNLRRRFTPTQVSDCASKRRSRSPQRTFTAPGQLDRRTQGRHSFYHRSCRPESQTDSVLTTNVTPSSCTAARSSWQLRSAPAPRATKAASRCGSFRVPRTLSFTAVAGMVRLRPGHSVCCLGGPLGVSVPAASSFVGVVFCSAVFAVAVRSDP